MKIENKHKSSLQMKNLYVKEMNFERNDLVDDEFELEMFLSPKIYILMK